MSAHVVVLGAVVVTVTVGVGVEATVGVVGCSVRTLGLFGRIATWWREVDRGVVTVTVLV